MVHSLFSDLRVAMRSLPRTPRLFAGAVGCLAGTIGADTTVFAIVNGVPSRHSLSVTAALGALGIAMVSAFVAARTAAAVDPLVAMRTE